MEGLQNTRREKIGLIFEVTVNYRFGHFILRSDQRELLKDGIQVRMQPKAFDLLLYLLENRDRVVSKEEILDTLWPDIHVSETALTRCIMKARRAVEDDADQQSVIKTIHGHGYRFVTEAKEYSEVNFPEPAAQAVSSSRKRNSLFAAMLGGLVLLATLFAGLQFFTGDAGTRSFRIAVLPIENATDDLEMDWMELGLMSLVSNTVSEAEGVYIVPASRTIELLTDQDISAEGELVVPIEVFQKYRSAEGATHLIASRLLEENEVFTLQYSMFDGSGELLSKTVIGDSPTVLAKLVGTDVLQTLSGGFSVKIIAVAEEDPFVSEATARGTAFRLKGDLTAASKMFEAALESAPDNKYLKLQLAVATSELADHEKAKALFDELLVELDEATPPRHATQLHAAIAYYHANLGDMESARIHRTAQLEFARQTDDDIEIGKALRGLGDVAAWTFNFDEGRSLYLRARRSFESGGMETPPGYLLGSMAILEAREGNYALADQYFNEAVERFKLENDDQKVMYTMLNIGILRYESGNWLQAGVYFEEALELARNVNDLDVEASALISWGLLEISTGDFTKAEELSLEALRLSDEHGYDALKALSLRNLGMISRRWSKLSEATSYFEQLYDVEHSLDNQIGLSIAEVHFAKVLLDERRFPEAIAKAEEALGRMQSSGGQGPEAFALSVIADAELELNNIDKAIQYYEEALAYETQQNAPVEAALLHARIGAAYIQKGELAKAVLHQEMAEALAPGKFFTYKLKAQVEQAREDLRSAKESMEQARRIARDNWTSEDEEILISIASDLE